MRALLFPSMTDFMTSDVDQAAPLTPPLHFNAVIMPHRSLSLRGFLILISVVAASNFAAGSLFMARGAWPVFFFCMAEVAAIWWAFRVNYRAARAYETVQLSDGELRVRRVDAKGRLTSRASFQPYWVRLALSEAPDSSTKLHLVSHGRKVEVAAALSGPERADFADALERALAKMRAGPASTA
jgi:uncharacterized membrane protein